MRIPDALRQEVAYRDQHRCAYCQTSQLNSGVPLTYDHIHPQSKGGATTLDIVSPITRCT